METELTGDRMSIDNAREWLHSQNKYELGSDSAFEIKKSKKAKTISVTSGKGGVGKTSLSLKCAQNLAKKGYRTLLIDCDYNLSNTVIKLGLPLNNDFYSLISAKKDFDECIHKMGNFHLLSACNGSLDLFDKGESLDSFIIDIINSHENDYDYIVLDCAAGVGKETLNLNAYCDYRFVVVTPDKSSITDSYSLIKILKNKFGVTRNHLLINKVSSNQQFKKMVKTLSETVENFLSSRLSVLGGVEYISSSVDQFDKIINESEKNSFSKNIDKVIHKFTEEDRGNDITRLDPSMSPLYTTFEQDVQPIV